MKPGFAKKIWVVQLAIAICTTPIALKARAEPQAQASEMIYEAITMLVNSLKTDLPAIAKRTKRVTLASVSLSGNIAPEIRQYAAQQINGLYIEKNDFRFIDCKECLSVRAETVGDEIRLKKGLNDRSDIAKMASSLGVTAYADTSLVYSGARLSLSISIYQVDTGAAIFQNTYRVRIPQLSESGFKLSFGVAQGLSLGMTEGYPFAASITAGERLYGFGLFGLNFFASSPQGDIKTYFSVGPEIDFNLNEIFSIASSWGAVFFKAGGGFSLYDGERNFNLLLGTKVEFGSMFFLNLDLYNGLAFPTENTRSQRDSFPATLFLGFGVDL